MLWPQVGRGGLVLGRPEVQLLYNSGLFEKFSVRGQRAVSDHLKRDIDPPIPTPARREEDRRARSRGHLEQGCRSAQWRCRASGVGQFDGSSDVTARADLPPTCHLSIERAQKHGAP